ncbi:MAG TPA: hypothetical protein VGO58_18785 [Chitinophagaceae bacterium]|jgi:hypothetical protein|nr:hypothetical protein [Chitinophagaceae bacterium]
MNQFISLETAVEMTSLYRQEKENILDPAYRNQNILARSETFDREVLDTLLAKTGCASVRIYYGMDKSLKIHAILVAVNENNEDILPSTTGKALAGNDIGEQGYRCPEECPPPSALNP